MPTACNMRQHDELIERLADMVARHMHRFYCKPPHIEDSDVELVKPELVALIAAALSAPSVAPQKDAGDDMTGFESLVKLVRAVQAYDYARARKEVLPSKDSRDEYNLAHLHLLMTMQAIDAALDSVLSSRPPTPTPSPSLAAHAKGEDGK